MLILTQILKDESNDDDKPFQSFVSYYNNVEHLPISESDAMIEKHKLLTPTLFELAYPNISVKVSGLPKEADEKFLEGLFGNFGKVKSATILRDSAMNSMCAGIVNMYEVSAVQKAITYLNGLEVAGKTLRVCFYDVGRSNISYKQVANTIRTLKEENQIK